MRTSSECFDTTAHGSPYSAKSASMTIGAVRATSVRDTTSYDSWMAATSFESSTVEKLWPVVTTSIHQGSDRTSELRKRVLSYRAEHSRDSSLAQAVNDALRFIDLIPATAILPQIALADDGEVNFFWRGNGLLIDIGFIGDGMMHYYISDEAKGVDSDDSIQFSGRSLPRDIEMAMPRFLGEFGTYSHGRVY